MKSFWQWFLKASLWICSIGLMVSSAGLDGAYLSKLMPEGWAWLGLVLNFVADVTSEIGMYWYGRLRVDNSSTKRKNAKWILVGEGVLVLYAWLFGWRQLVPIVARVDPTARWMAPVGAFFIPSAVVVVGYILSQLAGRIENKTKTTQKEEVVEEPAPIEWTPATFADALRVTAGMNGETESLTVEELAKRLAAEHKTWDLGRSSKYRWVTKIKEGKVNDEVG